jgi:hypothetical protein
VINKAFCSFSELHDIWLIPWNIVGDGESSLLCFLLVIYQGYRILLDGFSYSVELFCFIKRQLTLDKSLVKMSVDVGQQFRIHARN